MSARIFIAGQELKGFTDMRLKREKDKLTGELSVSVFMNWVPDEPVFVGFQQGEEILVYINNRLAFTGIVDRRRDTAGRSGDSGTTRSEETRFSQDLSIGPNEYTLQFTARGKTKYLIDSSQQHPTGTLLRPTTRECVEQLISPFGITLRWEADEEQLDKLRLRDGARVVDELQRIAEQASLYIYESKDGELKVQDGPPIASGEPIVLGINILSFSTDQAEDIDRSQVQVKGQRIEKEVWGEPAIIPPRILGINKAVSAFKPLTVHLYGNGTKPLLEKRAQYEINKRTAKSKEITLDVFHIQQTTGEPWDIGVIHYVEIPPAGVFGNFEVTALEYVVDADQTLKTRLTLSPPPVKLSSGDGASDATGFMNDVRDNDQPIIADTRRSRTGAAGTERVWKQAEIDMTEPDTVKNAIGDATDSGILTDVYDNVTRPPDRISDGNSGGFLE